jgi:hypothetical protein
MFRRDAGTGVTHKDFEITISRIGGDFDRTGFGEFDGIADEIEKDLAQAALISASRGQAIGDDG